MGTITKGIGGYEDLRFKSSGTTRQTFTRLDAASRTITLNQIDGADIQFRTIAKTLDDLVDGGGDVPINVSTITSTAITCTTVTASGAISGTTIDASSTMTCTTITASTSVVTDTIAEENAGVGVTVDSCPIKDGGVGAVTDQGGGNNLIAKVIEIGDWDMNAAASHNVSHGIGASYKNIRSVSVIIRDDDDTNYYKLERVQSNGVIDGGVGRIEGTLIVLERFTGGFFDSSTFDDVGGVAGNRGWVTIWYTE